MTSFSFAVDQNLSWSVNRSEWRGFIQKIFILLCHFASQDCPKPIVNWQLGQWETIGWVERLWRGSELANLYIWRTSWKTHKKSYLYDISTVPCKKCYSKNFTVLQKLMFEQSHKYTCRAMKIFSDGLNLYLCTSTSAALVTQIFDRVQNWAIT